MVLRTNRQKGTQFYGCSNFSRGCRGSLGYKAPADPAAPTPQSPAPAQPATPANQPTPQTPPQGGGNWYTQNVKKKPWVASKFVADGRPVVVTPNPDGKTWTWMDESGASGETPVTQLKTTFKSVTDAKGEKLTGFDAAVLFAKMQELEGEQPLSEENDPTTQQQPTQAIDPSKMDEKRKRGVLPDHMLSEEQRGIDQEFSTGQGSMMIDALAGSGKTTMLRHLASKYGNPAAHRWLYLVFNTKNKVEAKQKFPDDVVQVHTTNGFLGQILSTAAKRGAIPSTERMKSIEPKGQKLNKADQVPSKTELFVDGPNFVQMMRTGGVLPQGNLDQKLSMMRDFDKQLIKTNLSKIRNGFGNAVTQLTGLCKSFAVDPRKPDLNKQIENVLVKYDVDHDLLDMKEAINKYKEPLRSNVIRGLATALGYDFMSRSYKNECVQATAWMLKECLPGASKQVFNYKGKQHNLGQYRDFDDDLWYAAINADKMDWTNGDPRGYTHVLADEVQDFNECQKIALKHMHGKGSRVENSWGQTS